MALRLNSRRNSIQLLVQPHWTHKMVARLDAVALEHCSENNGPLDSEDWNLCRV